VSSTEISGWLCVGQVATGFANRDADGWKAVAFKEETFVVKKPDRRDVELFGTNLFWVVSALGEQGTRHYCEKESKVDVNCEGAYGWFTLNKENLRFQWIYPIGYVEDSKRDNPQIQIGKCTKI